MSFYLYLLLGFLGGIPAGMGMGGGTVTIPLLVLVGGVEQKIAQCANLFSFLPMSVGALKMHAENKLLKTDGLLWVILPALALSVLGATLAAALPSPLLRRSFGVFLIGLSFVGFYRQWTEKVPRKS
ncbi:MAG: sulfite exporter TauE/SafE family protein [Clostridia bacterium]|nr:sulfite exporter TauE/SafE family protein [Clostridia bacterium]